MAAMPDSTGTQAVYKQDCAAVDCGIFGPCTVVQSHIAIVGMLSAMTRPHMDPSSGVHVSESRGRHAMIKQKNKGINKETYDPTHECTDPASTW